MTTLQVLKETPEEAQLSRLDTAIGDIYEGVDLMSFKINGLDWMRQFYPQRLNERDQLAPISDIKFVYLHVAYIEAELARQERILKILAGRA
jgi:hypothetical protein